MGLPVCLVASILAAGADAPAPIELFLLPIAAVAVLAGAGPALAATAASAVLAGYFLVLPRHSLALGGGDDIVVWGATIAAGLGASALTWAAARALPDRPQGADTELRVRVAFVVALSVLGAIAAASYANAWRHERWHRLVGNTHEALAALAALRHEVTEAETSQRGYLLTGDDRLLEAHDAALDEARREVGHLEAITADNPDQRARLARLAPLVRQRLAFSADVLRVTRDGSPDAARAIVGTGKGIDLQAQIARVAATLGATERDLLQQRERGVQRASMLTRVSVLGAAALGLTFLATAQGLIRRGFAQARAAEATLQEANQQLEARVQERTAELARAHQELRLLIQQAPVSLAMFDRNMRYLATSRLWLEEYGRGHADLVGQCHYDLFPDLPEAWREAHRRGLAGELVRNDDDAWVDPGGVRHFLRWAIQPWRDEAGEVGGIITTAEDTTARRQIERRLAESERQYRLLAENSSDVIWVLDPEAGRFLYVSPSVERLRGTTPQEVMEQGMDEALCPGSAARLRDALPARLAEFRAGISTTHIDEVEQPRKDGTTVWTETSTRYVSDPESGRLLVYGSSRDIGERKKAQDLLRQREDLLALTSRLAQVGGWEFDVRTMVGTWTEETARIHDVDPDLPTSVELGLRFYEGPAKEAIEKAVGRAVEQGEPYDLELELTSAVGAKKWVRTVGIPVLEGGVVVKVQGAIQDVTAAHRARQRLHESEERLQLVNAELEQRVADRTAELRAKNQELETFSYSVSHDLKAPLRGIDGYSRLLLEDHAERLDEEGRAFLHNVRRGVGQMGRLIDDLLAYSRIERRALETARIDVRELVDSLVAARADDARPAGIAMAVDVPRVEVLADRQGLEMALRNLLDNALKFAGNRPGARVEIGGEPRDGWCRLWVRDNGPGFEMKFHDRIFQIFQRLHRAEDFPGTGVGLALVRKALERMGGRVWAESSPGCGASFFLEVPR